MLLIIMFWLGLLILLFGCIFRIMHWPGGNMMLWIASILQAAFYSLATLEVLHSKKYNGRFKKIIAGLFLFMIPMDMIGFRFLEVLLWNSDAGLVVYLLRVLLFIGLGATYLSFRCRFVFSKWERGRPQFDFMK